MMHYQCRFLNHANEVFSRVSFDADNDDDAIRHALAVYRNGVGKGFELWSDNRLLHSYVYGQTAGTGSHAGMRSNLQ
jgi:hypothetical protein